MSDTFFVGTAPFCDPSPIQCEKTPGYKATGTDKQGDGAACWTGNKIKCEFDEERWKKSATYKELVREDPNAQDIVPHFVWMGKAPACGASACDVFETGMLPIKNDNCGNGSCCTTGEKWLGMRPLLKKHRSVVEAGMRECFEFKKLQEKTLQAGLSMGNAVATTIGAVLTKV